MFNQRKLYTFLFYRFEVPDVKALASPLRAYRIQYTVDQSRRDWAKDYADGPDGRG